MKVSKESLKILIVEDKSVSAKFLQNMLNMSSLNISKIESAVSLNDAFRILDKDYFDVMLLDLNLPDSMGLDTIVRMNKRYPGTVIIVITVVDEEVLGLKAVASGAGEYLVKGRYDIDLLARSIYYAIERKKLEEDIKRAAKVWEMTFNSITAMILIQDKDCKIVKVNKACSDFFKMKPEELIGKNYYVLLHEIKEPLEDCLLRQVSETKKLATKEVFELHLGIYLEVSASPIFDDKGEVTGSVHIANDITERKHLEKKLLEAYNRLREIQDQLIQTEKTAAIGRLAFGIAHEIRNPLAIILKGVESLKNNLQKKDNLSEGSIQRIKHCVDRINNIIGELLKFSRASKLKLQSVNICELLDSTIALIRNKANFGNIKIIRTFPEKDIRIKADYNMLKQAFFNLGANALDAMPEGGKLYFDVNLKKSHKGDGSKAIIEVRDTGKSIPKDKLSKIFDPFFTTKEVGKGTGLGLSIVRLILERHNATIEVESRIDRGTRFIISLSVIKNK